ncbi:MAG TPA: hypothetical protein VGM52_13035 [Herbaspirillum sp.]
MNRLHLLQNVSPLSMFGHKIQDSFPVARTTFDKREPARNAAVFQHAVQHSFQPAATPPRPVPSPAPAPHIVTMHITVDASDLMHLRQLAATVCGDKLSSIRVQPIAHAKRMSVWLSLKYDVLASDLVMIAIMRQLPRAQFGHFEAN